MCWCVSIRIPSLTAVITSSFATRSGRHRQRRFGAQPLADPTDQWQASADNNKDAVVVLPVLAIDWPISKADASSYPKVFFSFFFCFFCDHFQQKPNANKETRQILLPSPAANDFFLSFFLHFICERRPFKNTIQSFFFNQNSIEIIKRLNVDVLFAIHSEFL